MTTRKTARGRWGRCALLPLGFLLPSAAAAREMPVRNASFEEDRFTKPPGYASAHPGGVSGWTYEGNVGINPCWSDTAQPRKPRHFFSDNGRIPHGKQVLFLQNACTVSQRISGFRAGKEYRVHYFENGRATNRGTRPAVLSVRLGGQVVVSPHPVTAVEPAKRRRLPYYRVESALFTAPADGDFELVFETTQGGGISVLIDRVRIVELP